MTADRQVDSSGISIVIPTLNEEKCLRKTLLHARSQSTEPDALHFIVIDAGSEDETLKSIADLGMEVHSNPKWRGKKYASLNVGLQLSQSPVTLFLDADTLLPRAFDEHVLRTLAQPKVIGGAFEMTFDQMDWQLWVVRLVNRLRYRIEKLYYGDQALFCRTSSAMDVGGIPETPLMEAAYFCRALKRSGRLRLIRQEVITSARRFRQHGRWKVFWFDIRMWLRFTARRDISKFADGYWSQNNDPVKPPPTP
ncbi:MAG: glycosyltransferase family 2 protein [Bacteroidota bacterium]